MYIFLLKLLLTRVQGNIYVFEQLESRLSPAHCWYIMFRFCDKIFGTLRVNQRSDRGHKKPVGARKKSDHLNMKRASTTTIRLSQRRL